MTPQQFRDWRTRLGYNVSEAGRRLDLDRGTISRYENGLTPIPRAVALACAALALGLSEYPPA